MALAMTLIAVPPAGAQDVSTPAAAAKNAAAAPAPAAQVSAMPRSDIVTPAAATAVPSTVPHAPAASAATKSSAAPEIAHPDGTPAATAPPPAAAVTHAEKLPRDLSPWGMFKQADMVVKAVMLGLLSASLLTWTAWLAKTVELAAGKRRLRVQLRRLAAANSLGEALHLIGAQRGALPAMLAASVAETRASWDIADRHAIKERVEAQLQRVELAAGRNINRGTGVLATIGSVAPFVGLFGTVWGIMNSFIGISEAQTTNLAVVAPGIAEALLATAFGLVAAIPAVIVYNHFARAIGGYKALVGDAAVAVQCILSRDLDRGVRPEQLRAAERAASEGDRRSVL